MIEAYAFLAAFTVQILVVSVFCPGWLARYARAKAEAQLPSLDRKKRERFLNLYRAINAGIAVLGLGLLGWLFGHMRSPDWDAILVTKLLSGYIMAQMVPLVLISMVAAWVKKSALTQSSPEARRTASLRRRGLFDIVSPFTVFVAVLAYVLFAAFILHVQQHPVPGFPGYRLLTAVTLPYILNAFCVYFLLYRRKKWPLETRAYRMQSVEVQIKITLYASICFVLFSSLSASLKLLHLLKWVPFSMSVFVVFVMLLTSELFFALRRQVEADLRTRPAS